MFVYHATNLFLVTVRTRHKQFSATGSTGDLGDWQRSLEALK